MDIPLPITPETIRVAIDLIDDDGTNMRRVPATAVADAVLESSIKRNGVLQPIGVRLVGNRYSVTFGRRRLRLAQRAGLTEIPVHLGAWSDNEIRAVQAAENLHREQTHPVDLWRTVRDLRDQGFSIEDAAAALCHTPRDVQLLERLGRLDAELLALAEIELPEDHQLRVIASAPHKAQRAALKAHKPVKLPNGELTVRWHMIAHACRVQQIKRGLAIFDTAAHADMWVEDLFAQPDDDSRIFTNDVPRFLKLQGAALKARVEQQRAAKQRVQLAEWDGAKDTIKLPTGFKLVSAHVTDKTRAKKTECIFAAVRPDGAIFSVLAEDVAAKKAAERATKAKAKKDQPANPPRGTIHSQAEDEGELDADDAPASAAPADKPGISKAGLTVVAQQKTEALHATLRDGLAELPLERLVALLLLAFAADNVELRIDHAALDDDHEWSGDSRLRTIGDVIDPLLLPGGGLADISGAQARDLAATLLRRILKVGGPDEMNRWPGNASGDAAEWIGAAIGAGDAVGRFDTEAFLATVNGDELRRAAEAAGIKANGAVGALRARLVGHLPDWRPAAAQFGAPAPRPRD